MDIIRVTNDNVNIWAQLCNELWSQNPVVELLEAFGNGEYQNEYIAFIDGICIAFISLSLRNDYVEGKEDSNPVGYIEGLYVRPEYRKQGVAKELVAYAKKWSMKHGCSMLASDCELSNEESRLFHNKIGFDEANINVHFKMNLRQ